MSEAASPRLLVVGSKGTLGAHFVRALDAEGIDFRVHEASAFRTQIASAETILNVGGPRVRPGLTAQDYDREHVGIVSELLRTMKPGAHLIHMSSTAVFGQRSGRLTADTEPMPDRFPNVGYAQAKLRAEEMARRAAKSRPVSILRPSMVVGRTIESAVSSLATLAKRGVALRLSEASHHLTQIELLEAAIRAVMDRPGGDRPILVVDPFILGSRDLDFPSKVEVPLPIVFIRRVHARLSKVAAMPLSLEALAVLGLGNEYDADDMFSRLGLDRARFSRARTFDPMKAALLGKPAGGGK